MSSRLRILCRYLWTLWMRRRFANRAALEAWQERRVRRFLKRIRPLSSYTDERFEGRSVDRWRELEPIEKVAMMANFDRLNTVGVTKQKAFEVALEAERSRDFSPSLGPITVGLSSGTSGNRGLFLVAPREQDIWVGSFLAKVLPRSILSRARIALFLRANSNLYEATGRGRLTFDFYDLISPIPAHVARLNAAPPDILIAPPSLLRCLAAELSAGRLKICPERLVSAAEVLDPVDEGIIAEAFGQAIHQVYQCTEGFLGMSCAEGTLHLNEDGVIIEKEYIDERREKFVPIVTDFSRTSQPIIRYRLNDILTEAKTPCPCGSLFTSIASIEGRCDDLFEMPTYNGDVRPVFPDFIRRAVIASTDTITDYQVVQRGPSELTLALRCRPGAVTEVEFCAAVERLQTLFAELGCRAPTIRRSEDLHRAGLTKLRRVERRFDTPPEG